MPDHNDIFDAFRLYYGITTKKEKTMDKRDNITNIVIEGDGKKTVALVASDKDGRIVETVSANCAPEDEYNFNIGAKLVMDRLYNGYDFTPRSKILYSGKILIIDPDHEDNEVTYGCSDWEVKDGLITSLCYANAKDRNLRILKNMSCSELTLRVNDMYFLYTAWSRHNKVMYLKNDKT